MELDVRAYDFSFVMESEHINEILNLADFA